MLDNHHGGDFGGEVKKTAKLTQIDKQSDSGRRLVEYFVVVSSVEIHHSSDHDKSRKKDKKNNADDMSFSEWKTETNNEDEEDELAACQFRPTITARYPIHDHADNPLHENVTFFCHPSGGICLRTTEYMPKVHYFVATGGTGRQIYGTCLTLWEPYDLKIKSKSSDQKEDEIRKVFVPKCLVILSTYPYLIAFREYLTQLNRLSKSGEMTLPIERYIVNFCAEIPAPPPGSFEVQTTILDSVIKFWSPPHNLPIPWVSLPFSNLFECLDIDNIILTWHCLVLERQVLITSTQLSILTTASEIFLSLLFPMRWSHAYIPILPHFLIPILSAPMPFLCGINKANLADALYDLSADCVLVDLDKNLVTLGPETAPLPPLPPFQEGVLRAQLEANVGMVFRAARSLTKNDDYSDSGTHLPTHTKIMAEAMWESKLCLFDEAFHLAFTPEEARKNHLNGNDASGMDISDNRDITHPLGIHQMDKQQNVRKQSEWDAVQEAFLDTFVYLLRNYRKYLVFPSKHNEGSYGGAGFRSKEFIESQRYDMREFLEQLIGTQMFDNFITKRLYGSGEADVAFFDMAVDRFLKNAGMFADVDLGGRLLDASGLKGNVEKPRSSASRPKGRKISRPYSAFLKKEEDPLLQSARVHRKLKTIVPPEPSGEGLQSFPLMIGDDVTCSTDDDEASAYSASSRGSKTTKKTSAAGTPPRKSGLKLPEKKIEKKFVYDSFPTEFKKDLFGTPRPLPSAVIVEFDRQRKDAAQFRRKAQTPKTQDSSKHFQRAHSTVDPVAPPSPEVATFTVFFLAFTAMVGKELVDMAHDPSANDKTILSTYVPTTLTESETDADSEAGGMSATTSDDGVDVEEKAHVAEMKTSRPNLGGMFGDEEDDVDQFSPRWNESQGNGMTTWAPKDLDKERSPSETPSPTKSNGRSINGASSTDSIGTEKSTESQPRSRFRDKLSDLQIEEAKATGRAQLGLAFEMLTMMKKRALKADPETYQCLIDACGRVGDTKRATDLLAKMHEDGIVADGTVYACLVSAFSAESAWKDSAKNDDLPEWANSTAVEMDWNKLQKRSLLDRIVGQVVDLDDEDDEDNQEGASAYQKLRRRLLKSRNKAENKVMTLQKTEDNRMEFFVTETVERQIALGENLLEIVFPDISIDTENEVCPRCNFLLSDDDVVAGWTPDSNDYTTSCPNCTQRFVPHFCVQCSAPTFVGSKGPASPLMCERLSPWVLQKEIRSVMNEREGIDNLLSPSWREQEYKNSVLWWNLVLSCMRYRFPFSFLLQGSFDQNLIAPLPEDDN